MCRKVIRNILFFLIGLLLFIGVNYFMRPFWSAWGAEDRSLGFYEQPRNTIETVFLGASATVTGIIPMELYRDYGMCAYNLALEQQYIITSYYWLQTAFELHGDTLKNVVLNAATLFSKRNDELFHKAMDGMHLSNIKIRAAHDYSESWDETLNLLLPLLTYHNRWDSLTKKDFEKIVYEPETYLRGYHFVDMLVLDKDNFAFDQLALPTYYDETENKSKLTEETLHYFDKIVTFCSENGLNLILWTTPGRFTSAQHNAVKALAAGYGLDYIDFNLEPYVSAVDYNRALDTTDGGHPNYYLATKITSLLGKYLVDYYETTDVRGNENYAFMDEELRIFEKNTYDGIYMDELTDVFQYIEYAIKQGYTLLISVKDEGSASLTEAHRAALADFGLEKLSELQYRDSYLAVVEDGKVTYEASQESGTTGNPISYNYILKDGARIELISGGMGSGNISSCLVDDAEYSLQSRGLNIAVYNTDTGRVVNTAAFDTFVSTERETANLRMAYESEIEQGISFSEMSDAIKKLHLYNQRVENDKLSKDLGKQMGEDDLLLFLDTYWGRPDTAIFISVIDEAAGTFDPEIRGLFAQKYGLPVLSELEWRDSYIAVIDSGKVLFEQRDHGESPLEWCGIGYSVVSGGAESGWVSSIKIEDVEYSKRQRGLNIVIYDTLLEKVVNNVSFDTCAIPQKR